MARIDAPDTGESSATPSCRIARARFDIVLLAVGAVVQIGFTIVASRHQVERRSLDAIGIGLLAVGLVALPFRHRHPVAVLAFVFSSTLAYWAAGYPRGPVFFALVVALAQAVITGHRRAAIASLVAGYVGFLWLGPALGTARGAGLGGAIALAAGLVALLSVIEVVRSRRERATEAARREVETAQRRASDERLRIARELHDAVAHNMSLINIQAGVALHLFDEKPGYARDALATIRESSKEALVELRSILGVLRQVDAGAPRAPTPSLAGLDELVHKANSAGLAVTLDVDPALPPLPRSVDLAAYRIVQESLTNVARHAGRPEALVRVRADAGALTIEVLDEGIHGVRVPDLADLPSGGNGIAGMRERAASVGGSLETGPRPGRGYAVRATLPLDGDS